MISRMRGASGVVIILLCFAFILGTPVSATIFTSEEPELAETNLFELTNTTAPPDEKEPVIFLYDPYCESCQPAHEYLTRYLEEHPDVKVDLLDSTSDPRGQKEYEERTTAFNRETLYVPVIFIGPLALEGKNDIMTHFETVYQWYTG